MANVFVVLEPTYHSRRILEVVASLPVAKAVMCEAIGLRPHHFSGENPSYWWDQETRGGGITVYSIGTAGDPAVSGWVIEVHAVRGRIKEVVS